MPQAPIRDPRGIRPLMMSLAWMFTVQLACVVLWDAGSLTRVGALAHWLVLGVLPPALALWTTRAAPRAGGAEG